jgi:hypothetical protein
MFATIAERQLPKENIAKVKIIPYFHPDHSPHDVQA